MKPDNLSRCSREYIKSVSCVYCLSRPFFWYTFVGVKICSVLTDLPAGRALQVVVLCGGKVGWRGGG